MKLQTKKTNLVKSKMNNGSNSSVTSEIITTLSFLLSWEGLDSYPPVSVSVSLSGPIVSISGIHTKPTASLQVLNKKKKQQRRQRQIKEPTTKRPPFLHTLVMFLEPPLPNRPFSFITNPPSSCNLQGEERSLLLSTPFSV